MKVCTAYINAFMNRQYGKWSSNGLIWWWGEHGFNIRWDILIVLRYIHQCSFKPHSQIGESSSHYTLTLLKNPIIFIFHHKMEICCGIVVVKLQLNFWLPMRKDDLPKTSWVKEQVFGLPWFQQYLSRTKFGQHVLEDGWYMICLTIIHNCV